MNKQPLNFDWKFISGFNSSYLNIIPSNAENIDIPHTVKIMPLNYFDESEYQGLYTYFKVFDVTNFNKDKVFILRFNGYMVKAKIYLNSHYFGEFASLYNPVEIDVTSYLKERNNNLIVILSTIEDPNLPPFGYIVDYLTFGGIYRGVELLSYQEKYVAKTYVFGDMNGNISVKDIVSKSLDDKENITHYVYFQDELVAEFKGEHFKLEKVRLWDIDNPNLYTLKTVYNNGVIKEFYETRFGFRNAEFKKDGFYLNDKKIKLCGLNRHQSYPYIGYAATKSLQIDDANILKYEAGINVVRTSHYPQDRSFLDRCDEIGLMVIDEIPGWQHIGTSSSWRDQHYKNIASMVETAYNHPSIIAHGVRIDESKDDYELYDTSNKIAHELDPHKQTLGVRNFKNSDLLEDVYAYNDFSCHDRKHGLQNRKKITKNNENGYLVTEYMGHMYPTKSFDNEMTRFEQSYRHARIINDANKYEDISGAIGWCAFDYNTHKNFGSGDRICYHGVFDIFRNRKYASYIYQSQNDSAPVLKVLSNMNKGEFPENFYPEIYIATNLDYVELYKNKKFIKRFYPNRKEFKYMKHPLIKVDDLIGDLFDDPRFNKKDRKTIAKIISKIEIGGMYTLSLMDKITIAFYQLRYKLKFSDLYDIYNAYCGFDINGQNLLEFKGFKNDKEIITEQFAPSRKFSLNISLLKNDLVNSDTYDTNRIVIKHVDEYNHVMSFSSLPLQIEVSGQIELLGPSLVSLTGGQTSIYIKSKKGSGVGKVTIKSSLGQNEIIMKVR